MSSLDCQGTSVSITCSSGARGAIEQAASRSLWILPGLLMDLFRRAGVTAATCTLYTRPRDRYFIFGGSLMDSTGFPPHDQQLESLQKVGESDVQP